MRELVTSFVADQTASGFIFDEDSIEVDIENLSDRFLHSNFDRSKLKQYFDDEAWTGINALLDLKIKKCTCRTCKKVCIDKNIACDECNA